MFGVGVGVGVGCVVVFPPTDLPAPPPRVRPSPLKRSALLHPLASNFALTATI